MAVRQVKNGWYVTEDFDISDNVRRFKESVCVKESIGQTEALGELYDIEAIHEGATKNHVNYTDRCLKSGVPTWTNPLPKPVLKDHCASADNAIGRVIKAEYNEEGKYTHLVVDITNPQALEKIKRKEYLTVSIGSMITSAKCSICEKEIVGQFCGHYRGERYKDNMPSDEADAIVCEWNIETLEHDEVSIVSIPADSKAHIMGPVVSASASDNRSESTTSKVTESLAETKAEVVNADEQKLSNGCFALVKTVDGVTTRELQYKNENGTINENSLKDSLARINQITGYSTAEKAKAKAQLKRAAKKVGVQFTEESIDVKSLNVLKELKEQVDVLKEQNEELQDQVNELTSVVDSLEYSIGTSFEDHSKLVAQLSAANELFHKERVERLVDIKFTTNRESSRTRDEVINEYITKSDEFIEELIHEFSKSYCLGKPPEVLNDTLPIQSDMHQDVVGEEDFDNTDVNEDEVVIPDMKTIKLAVKGDKEAQRIVEKWRQKDALKEE